MVDAWRRQYQKFNLLVLSQYLFRYCPSVYLPLQVRPPSQISDFDQLLFGDEHRRFKRHRVIKATYIILAELQLIDEGGRTIRIADLQDVPKLS